MDGFVNYDALAGSIKAEDIASDEFNAAILRQIMNDPQETSLWLASHENRHGDDYCPINAREMGWLGYFVGRSTCVTRLFLTPVDDFPLMEPFCRGVSRNKSIRRLDISDIEEGDLFKWLTLFFKNNDSLTELTVEECNFGAEGCRQLSLALGSCTNSLLTTVALTDCEITDDRFADIAVALSMHPKLEVLKLWGNSIGRNGCVALATLLQFSATNLTTLDLDGNDINDDGITALVPALAQCRKLECLDLSDNPTISVRGWRALCGLLEDPKCSLQRLVINGDHMRDEDVLALVSGLAHNLIRTLELGVNHNITEKGWAAISTLLCDTSSVNNTFLSNHTLNQIVPDSIIPDGVKTLLDINKTKDASKKEIAMMKILKHHEDLSMQPFFEWDDFKVLPLAVDWFARAQSISALDHATRHRIPAKKVSAIYQFVRGMPLVYVESRLRSQLDEIKSRKTKLVEEQMKLRQERLQLDAHEKSVMARLRG